ncbi:MAG: glycosyltransferase family 2 protein [Acidobacteriaceae bacterium]
MPQNALQRQEGGRRTRQGHHAEAPLISVITVVYNGSKSITPTVNSVATQTFHNYELIVVDGASTDGTVDALNQMDDKIDYWVSEPDAGIYDAMNNGIKLARGEWLYFLNSGDTFVSPRVLERIAAFLEQSSAPIVVGYVNVLDDGNAAGRFPLGIASSHSIRELFRNRFCHQALFIRRKSYQEVGGFDARFPTFADFFAFCRISKRLGGFEQVPIEIANFDLFGASSDYRKSLPLYRERERIFNQLGEKKSPPAYLIGMARAFAYRYKRMVSSKR